MSLLLGDGGVRDRLGDFGQPGLSLNNLSCYVGGPRESRVLNS